MVMPSGHSRACNRRLPIRCRGMTLTELLVAVGVLAIMVLGFGTILSQTQRVVVGAQESMRANGQAAAIEQIIRNDVLRVSKIGFMSVTDANGSPALVFTAAGVNQSLTGDARGLGSIVAYGLCDNDGAGAAGKILLRHGRVLDSDVAGGVDADQLAMDLAELQIQDAAAMDATKSSILAGLPSSLSAPASSLSEVGSLWQVLARDCAVLKIEWTTGDLSGGKLTWSSATQTWTRADQGNWPSAIKINFYLKQARRLAGIAQSTWSDPANDTNFRVDSTSELNVGEIIAAGGSAGELMRVTAVDSANSRITVIRGYAETTSENLADGQLLNRVWEYEIICPVGP